MFAAPVAAPAREAGTTARARFIMWGIAAPEPMPMTNRGPRARAQVASDPRARPSHSSPIAVTDMAPPVTWLPWPRAEEGAAMTTIGRASARRTNPTCTGERCCRPESQKMRYGSRPKVTRRPVKERSIAAEKVGIRNRWRSSSASRPWRSWRRVKQRSRMAAATIVVSTEESPTRRSGL